MKKKILFAIIIAAVLVSSLVLGCVFAFGNTATDDKIHLVVSTTSDEVKSGSSFDVTVRITNQDITAFKVAGFQVELTYNNDKLTAGNITPTLNTTESTAVHKAADGKLVFVCVKNDFTEQAGYTTLNDLFKVTFTAKSDIADPSKLFTNDNVSFLVGDTNALKIELADDTYAGSIPKLAEALLGSEFTLGSSEKIGTVVIAPAPAGSTPMSKAELESAIDGATVDGNIVGTGSNVQYEDESAQVVIKGDVDGNGVVDVFDAMLIDKAQNNDNAQENFDNRPLEEFAGDVNNDNNTNITDVENILDQAVSK